jgi:hypothetical protein
MARKRVGKHPIAFRQMALGRMKTCASVLALAEALGVHRTVLYHWQRQKEAAHVGLARAYALQKETAKARAVYHDFLTLWKDADAEIPVLKQAKAEYAKL